MQEYLRQTDTRLCSFTLSICIVFSACFPSQYAPTLFQPDSAGTGNVH